MIDLDQSVRRRPASVVRAEVQLATAHAIAVQMGRLASRPDLALGPPRRYAARTVARNLWTSSLSRLLSFANDWADDST
jgi:hypothetical protein